MILPCCLDEGVNTVCVLSALNGASHVNDDAGGLAIHVPALFEPCCLLLLSEIEDMAPFSPKVLTANQGHRVSCTAPQGIPTPQVWWERNQERVPTAGRVYQEAEQLVFTSITEMDAGIYTCHAANKAGEKKQELSITVASRKLSEKGGRRRGAG